jgi:two-component system chemotaxis sensor kinase CheA
MAVPLAMVARLEEFSAAQVERSTKGLVVQYRGQIMPLIDIAQGLGIGAERSGDGPLQVIVYSQAGESVGLIVEKIVDVVEQNVEVKREGDSGGLSGSAVLQERITDLLDVGALVGRAGMNRELRS